MSEQYNLWHCLPGVPRLHDTAIAASFSFIDPGVAPVAAAANGRILRIFAHCELGGVAAGALMGFHLRGGREFRGIAVGDACKRLCIRKAVLFLHAFLLGVWDLNEVVSRLGCYKIKLKKYFVCFLVRKEGFFNFWIF